MITAMANNITRKDEFNNFFHIYPNHVPIRIIYTRKNNKNNSNNVTPPLMKNGKNSKRKKKKTISSVFIVLQQHSNRNVTHRPDKKKNGNAKDEQTKRVYTMRDIYIHTYIHIRFPPPSRSSSPLVSQG